MAKKQASEETAPAEESPKLTVVATVNTRRLSIRRDWVQKGLVTVSGAPQSPMDMVNPNSNSFKKGDKLDFDSSLEKEVTSMKASGLLKD